MIAMEAASLRVKAKPGSSFNATAPSRVAKIPNCAAAPSNRVFGLAIRAPKSVKAPTPRKISSGKTPEAIPTS
jgi:hypothetical protein